ncbi:hypothetical protein L6164_034957 [Bauhinia variegata]|uniref:Uncharacterized protein n=1 Tax=Bauhinia variegata TaxID=167791 RepID=A0ACB9KWA2_BAUVA|nr:hypothetical protein L6164_034957 [Bauhinia variegata]
MGVLSEGFTQVKVSAAHHSYAAEDGYKKSLIGDSHMENGAYGLEVTIKCAEIQNAISVGVTSFLFTEYRYPTIFMAVFGAIIFLSSLVL